MEVPRMADFLIKTRKSVFKLLFFLKSGKSFLDIAENDQNFSKILAKLDKIFITK